jgi:pyridoxal phosphate enzyme (YggS family)
MIGNLQRNKVKYVVGHACLIHSVDSEKLARSINEVAMRKGVTAEVLVEVNVAGEESKFGVAPEETKEFVKAVSVLPHVHVSGLMTSAPFVKNAEENRSVFEKLHELSVDINRENIDNVTMRVLSMGMTNDYNVAVEEGATLVRVGTAIFGARDYSK